MNNTVAHNDVFSHFSRHFRIFKTSEKSCGVFICGPVSMLLIVMVIILVIIIIQCVYLLHLMITYKLAASCMCNEISWVGIFVDS
jgi:hypothetical protein